MYNMRNGKKYINIYKKYYIITSQTFFIRLCAVLAQNSLAAERQYCQYDKSRNFGLKII
jgi:hypothetical protein